MKNSLYEWLFHFNQHKGIWYAFKREDYVGYFNGKEGVNTVASKNINTLIEIVEKTGGDLSKILKLNEE